MSYTTAKYGEGYDFPPVDLNISVSEDVETMLRVYTEGVRDADEMLGSLWDYFATIWRRSSSLSAVWQNRS